MLDRLKRITGALCLFAACLGGFASQGAAQSTLKPRSSDWSGLYIGVQAGYGLGTIEVLEDPNGAPVYNGAGNTWDYDTTGFLGGVHAGLNWESNALILGIEVSGGYLAVEGDAADPDSADTIAIAGNGFYADVTGKIGFAPDRMLYYMKGGLALADLDLSVEDTCNTGPCGTGLIIAVDDGTQEGWTAGAGIGYVFESGMSLRLEYNWYDFSDVVVTGVSSDDNTHTWYHDASFQTVTMGLSYIF